MLSRVNVLAQEPKMTLALSARRSTFQASVAPSLVALTVLLAGPLPAPMSPSANPAIPNPTVLQAYRQPPVFVENRGQWDGDFLYKTRVGPMTVFVEKNRWTFTLEERRKKPKDPKDLMAMGGPGMPEWELVRGVAVRMRFVGSPGAAKVIPGTRSSGVHNYFLGNDPARWRTEIPLCEGLRLVGVWPGVDIGLRFETGHLEYDVFVEPGADLAQVVVEVEGADGLRLDADGTPVIETPLGPIRQTAPRTWQIAEHGRKEPVACSFVLLSGRRFGFSAPGRDPERPLVIDPGLLYATYLGGQSNDSFASVALDPTGAATVAGETFSTNFPTTSGAYATSKNGSSDAFVARVSAAGDALVYATYLGGAGEERAYSVAVDAAGAATVVGRNWSTDFPTTAGAYDTTFNGHLDGFAVRLNAAGSGLVYATYLGGGSADEAYSVALDATGAATVVGETFSNNFPTTAGAYDTTYNSASDAFVVRLNAAGSGLVYGTYIGGLSFDSARSVALDATGEATVVGETSSTTFPTTAGAYDTSQNGSSYSDAFVVRLNAAGSGLVYATYLGGAFFDYARSVALDATGAATVVGGTSSTDFPTTAGAYDTTHNGGPFGTSDAFVVRLNAAGSGLVYATYLGGGSSEGANSVALDATGVATVAGSTSSTDFPTTAGAYDTTYNGLGASDTFVARLNATGSGLVYATYMGGGDYDGANSVALDATGAATVAGSTSSNNFPTTAGAYDTTPNGPFSTSDAFVVRLQLFAFPYPVMAFPDVQAVRSGGILGIQVAGPAGAPVALMFDPVATNIPVPPYGTIGLNVPPLLALDGIGLGFPGSIPGPLNVGSQGILYFSYSPVPASLVGTTLYVQAVAVDVSLPALPPFVGIGLSTHGNGSLPTPACQVTFVP
jgi:hypothetical protein